MPSTTPFKTIVRFFLICCLLLPGLACSLSTPSAPARPAAQGAEQDGAPTSVLPAETQALPAEAPGPAVVAPDGALDDSDVQIVAEMASLPAPQVETLGSATFTAESGAAVTAAYTELGEAVELSLTDAAGLTWTLSVPAGALDGAHTLKMTPLANVQSTEIEGLAGGVLLEPDGLQFYGAARLSVSGGALGERALIYSGAQDGTGIDFAQHEADGQAALIEHFSSYFTSADRENAGQAALRQYQNALAEAKVIRKQPLTVTEPPSTPLECTNEETSQDNSRAIQEWIKSAQSPEYEILQRLIKYRRALAIIYFVEGGYEGVGDTEVMLAERLAKKALKLQKTYFGKPEKLAAVAAFSVDVAYRLALIGVDNNLITAMLTGLRDWFLRAVEQMLEDVVQNHDYKKAWEVLELFRKASLLGDVSTEAMPEVMRKLEAALTFEVLVNFKADLPDEKWETESKSASMRAKMERIHYMNGSGNGAYLSATSPNAAISAPSFAVNFTIVDFNPCDGTVKIGLDRFGASAETYTPHDAEGETIDMPLVQNTGMALYEEYKSQDNLLGTSMYVFPMTLRNNDATAAQQTFSNAMFGKVSGVLDIKLIHTPQQ